LVTYPMYCIYYSLSNKTGCVSIQIKFWRGKKKDILESNCFVYSNMLSTIPRLGIVCLKSKSDIYSTHGASRALSVVKRDSHCNPSKEKCYNEMSCALHILYVKQLKQNKIPCNHSIKKSVVNSLPIYMSFYKH